MASARELLTDQSQADFLHRPAAREEIHLHRPLLPTAPGRVGWPAARRAKISRFRGTGWLEAPAGLSIAKDI